MNTTSILAEFGIDTNSCTIEPLGTGLINSTWRVKIVNSNVELILQRINKNVFKQPKDIGENIDLLSTYFKEQYPDYLFTHPVRAISTGLGFKIDEGEYYRLFPYIKNSKTLTTLQRSEQAFEAARQFGKFTSQLNQFDSSQLNITIPEFHNLILRYQQFEDALQNGNQQRIQTAAAIINTVKSNYCIVEKYQEILNNPDFKLRVTHHDTKISNVLFDNNDKGLCVIDLDTVMPGYFISDLGDMFRTYLCPVSEEEPDLTKIEIRTDFFEDIATGYLSEMKQVLTESEINHFVYAGEFMIYMQAIRFLTDYLNDDVYYASKYEQHNLQRALNQIQLLKSYKKAEVDFKKIVVKCLC